MRLSEVQADILNAFKLNSDQNYSDVADRLHVTEKTVRYQLDSLMRQGIIARSNFIDIYPLGLRYANLYFSVAGSESGVVPKLLAHLENATSVTWLAELGGDFHYGAAFAVRHFEDVRRELFLIPADAQAAVFERVMSAHLSLTMFPLKVLGWTGQAESERRTTIGYGRTGIADSVHTARQTVELDDVGWRLTALLSQEPELTLRSLAQRLGRSASTISDRIEGLRRDGIYRGTWLRVNFAAVGLSTYKLLVYTRGLTPQSVEAVRSFCRTHRNVDYIIECVGDWDFEVGLVVESAAQVMEATKALYDQLGAVIKLVKVLPLMRVLKFRQVPSQVR